MLKHTMEPQLCSLMALPQRVQTELAISWAVMVAAAESGNLPELKCLEVRCMDILALDLFSFTNY